MREASAPWLRSLAVAARRLAEDGHAGAEPVAFGVGNPSEGIPFEPLELRAAEIAASMLEELAELDGMPGCSAPEPLEAIEALDALRVRLWSGPTEAVFGC